MFFRSAYASVVITLLFLSQLSAQTSFDCIPKEAVAVIQVNQVERLSDKLRNFLLRESQDEAFLKLVCEAPYPLLTSKQLIQMRESLDQSLSSYRDIKSLTLYFTSLSPKIEYCLILEVPGDTGKELARKLLVDGNYWTKFGNSLFGDQVEKQGFDLALSSQDLIAGLAPTNVRNVANRVIVSNSTKFADWSSNKLESKIVAPDKSSISESRRFQRAVAILEKPFATDVFFFLAPTHVLPLVDKKYDKQLLKTYGVQELVGAAGKIEFEGPEESSVLGNIDFRMTIPFTLPRRGLSSHWDSLIPLKNVIDITPLVDKGSKLERATLTSRDRKKYLAAVERTYVENGDVGGFKKLMERNIRQAGSMDVHRSYFNGTSFAITTSSPEKANKTIRFYRTTDTEATLQYASNYVKSENKVLKFNFEETLIGGNVGWFLSDDNILKQAEEEVERRLFENEKQQLRNYGFLTTADWLIHGDKSTLGELVDESLVSMASLDSVIDKISQGAGRKVLRSQPGWIELNSNGFRRKLVLSDLRAGYLYNRFSKKKASKLFGKLMADDVLPIDSRSDRFFAVYYWVVNRVLKDYPLDIQSFSNMENRVEFSWLFQSLRHAN